MRRIVLWMLWIQITVKEKNYNVPENELIHVTDGAMNTNGILHDVRSDVDSEGEFEITHEDPEDQEIKLLVFQ